MKLHESGLEPVVVDLEARIGHRYDTVELNRADFYRIGRMNPWQLALWIENMQRGFRPFSPCE